MDDDQSQAKQRVPVERCIDPEPEMVINALALFDGRREIWIELDGVRYRLRITRRNKLILQK